MLGAALVGASRQAVTMGRLLAVRRLAVHITIPDHRTCSGQKGRHPVSSLVAVSLFGILLAFLTGCATPPTPTGPAPAVNALSQSSGLSSGGYTITISGQNFGGATSVDFGFLRGTDLVVVSSTQLIVTAPPAPPGAVDVRVTTPNGKSAVAPGGRFEFVELPAPVCTINWRGLPAGDWSDGGNWDAGRVPSSTDVACLPATASATISADAGAVRAVRSLGAVAVNGRLSITGVGAEGSTFSTLSITGVLCGSPL